MSIWDVPARIWAIGLKVDELLRLQRETDAAFKDIREKIMSLERRMTHQEANATQMVTEANAAAGMAASNIASHMLSDVVTRVTRLEMRQDEVQKRLP